VFQFSLDICGRDEYFASDGRIGIWSRSATGHVPVGSSWPCSSLRPRPSSDAGFGPYSNLLPKLSPVGLGLVAAGRSPSSTSLVDRDLLRPGRVRHSRHFRATLRFCRSTCCASRSRPDIAAQVEWPLGRIACHRSQQQLPPCFLLPLSDCPLSSPEASSLSRSLARLSSPPVHPQSQREREVPSHARTSCPARVRDHQLRWVRASTRCDHAGPRADSFGNIGVWDSPCVPLWRVEGWGRATNLPTDLHDHAERNRSIRTPSNPSSTAHIESYRSSKSSCSSDRPGAMRHVPCGATRGVISVLRSRLWLLYGH